MTTLEQLKTKARLLGAEEFGISGNKNKRFYVKFNGKKINFGSNTGQTYIDHHDEKKRKAWVARHSKIQDKEGNYVIKDKNSPSFWSHRLLW